MFNKGTIKVAICKIAVHKFIFFAILIFPHFQMLLYYKNKIYYIHFYKISYFLCVYNMTIMLPPSVL